MSRPERLIVPILLIGVAAWVSGCQQDEPPLLKEENERLRKQAVKQESVIVSLQEGNKVMQQQIDLLNRELREAKQETERVEGERKAVAAKLGIQAAQTLRVEDTGGQSEELPQALAAVAKAAEDALTRNGYAVRVSVKTDQKAVYVTERKVSAPASLEVSGFRNQYLVSILTLPSKGTRLSVKADFEKTAQGGRILAASPEEIAEIEKRLIAEIRKALTPGKV